MPLTKEAHFDILSTNINLLKDTPLSITSEQAERMRDDLNAYKEEYGTQDSRQASKWATLWTLTWFGGLFSIGITIALLACAAFGMISWWALPIPPLVGLLSSRLYPKFDAKVDEVSQTRWKASELKDLLKPWGKYEWSRANKVRVLTPEANAYFLDVLSKTKPLEFQLRALHRLSNTLTLDEELDIEYYGSTDAPVSCCYMEKHPNWVGDVPKKAK